MIQNINIARVSLITHGPVSALRTLHGVYIPRDVRVARRISRMRRNRNGTGRKRAAAGGGEKDARVFVLLRAQGPIVASSGATNRPWKPHVLL